MTEVAIVGAGNVAFTGACLLRHLGNEVTLWSPSGKGTHGLEKGAPISTSGSLNGTFDVKVAKSPRDICAAADLIMIAVPAYGHKAVFDQLAPWLGDEHSILIAGGQLGYGGLYLDHLLAKAGRKTQLGVIHGPITMGRKLSPTKCVQVPFKTVAWASAADPADTDALIARWSEVLGPRFRKAEHMLGVGMRAMGGIFHPALALGNITRMEFAEEWCGYGCTTESISNLTEALDADRLAVGRACGLDLPGIVAMFAKGDARKKTVQDALQPLTYERTFRNGPRNVLTRYIEEEVPYHIVTIEELGRKVGMETPAMTPIIDIYGAMRRKDYRRVNTMAEALGIAALSGDETLALWQKGIRSAASRLVTTE